MLLLQANIAPPPIPEAYDGRLRDPRQKYMLLPPPPPKCVDVKIELPLARPCVWNMGHFRGLPLKGSLS